jgi:hypothetical protein
MSDMQAWHETPGAELRRVLGVADPDVAVRAKELLDTAELEHRSKYGTAPDRQWPWQAATAAAAAEEFKIPAAMSSYEVAARWNAQHPLARMGVEAEEPNTGFAMRVFVNGQAQYAGDPATVEAMKASFAADAARHVQAAHASRVALGPLYGTVA